jgi:D-aminoacyl-tRNA deacylase
MILIVASNKDPASLNIRKQILSHYDFEESTGKFEDNPTYFAKLNNKEVKLVTLNEELVFAQNLTNFIETDLVIFVSRHSSESGIPTLSVHTPGNLGEAKLGGIPQQVSVSPANAMLEALRTMVKHKENLQLKYEVSYEGTHHGPSLDVPTMFVELGSSKEQWLDLEAAEAVGHAAIRAAEMFRESSTKTVLGIGGPHYNMKFTRMALEKKIAFGHMIPKYAVSQMSLELTRQCIDKTLEKVESTILDWKGIKADDKPALNRILEEIGIQTQKA